MDEIHSFIVLKRLLCHTSGMSHQNQNGFKKKISADKAFHHQWKKKKTKQKLKSNKKFSTIAHHLVAGNEEQNMNKNTTINIVL